MTIFPLFSTSRTWLVLAFSSSGFSIPPHWEVLESTLNALWSVAPRKNVSIFYTKLYFFSMLILHAPPFLKIVPDESALWTKTASNIQIFAFVCRTHFFCTETSQTLLSFGLSGLQMFLNFPLKMLRSWQGQPKGQPSSNTQGQISGSHGQNTHCDWPSLPWQPSNHFLFEYSSCHN